MILRNDNIETIQQICQILSAKLGFFNEVIGWINQKVGARAHIDSCQIGF
jgi:hypothetical protein